LWATRRWYGLTLCDPHFQCAQGDKKTKHFVSNSRAMSWSDTLWSMFSSMWLNSGVSTYSCGDFFSLQSHRYGNSGCWAATCIKSFFFCLPSSCTNTRAKMLAMRLLQQFHHLVCNTIWAITHPHVAITFVSDQNCRDWRIYVVKLVQLFWFSMERNVEHELFGHFAVQQK
jgi:hypothetical protein